MVFAVLGGTKAPHLCISVAYAEGFGCETFVRGSGGGVGDIGVWIQPCLGEGLCGWFSLLRADRARDGYHEVAHLIVRYSLGKVLG